MVYDCGHEGCDICGVRECDKVYLKKYYTYLLCEPCLRKAIGWAYEAACTFGGIVIDPKKQCGKN